MEGKQKERRKGKKRNNISGTKTADRNELYKGDRKTGLS